jgi:integrase
MVSLTKRVVDMAAIKRVEYFIWDDSLPGFGLRVFPSGKRSYLVQYRAGGRTRRYAIGLHGVWTPETARREARILLGRVAQGDNPAEEKRLDAKSMTVKELCERYLADCERGLIPGKKGRPKRPSTLAIDRSRINRHIIPLLGNRKVKDLSSTDVTRFVRDVAEGKTKVDVKTRRRGRAIVRGGIGTGTRGVGLLGGIFTYAIREGVIETNPAHGIRKVADAVRDRRLSDREYRVLGDILSGASTGLQFETVAKMIRAMALTGSRRGEIINLKGVEVDMGRSCFRLRDSKEGASIRPIGLPTIELLDPLLPENEAAFVFPGTEDGKPLVGFPKLWKKLLSGTPLADITPHVLRHSFASVANDLGFAEATVAALLGHSRGTVTSRYIHTVDTALVMAADAVSSYLNGLLDGKVFARSYYSLDRLSRRAALDRLFGEQRQSTATVEQRLAA